MILLNTMKKSFLYFHTTSNGRTCYKILFYISLCINLQLTMNYVMK